MTGITLVLLTTFLASSVEAIEMVTIVVGVGVTRGWRSTLLGAAVNPLVARIPRSFLQLIVGTMLTSFGTFWALEGLGVSWPQSDLDIAALLAFYGVAALAFIQNQRRVTRAAFKAVTS